MFIKTLFVSLLFSSVLAGVLMAASVSGQLTFSDLPQLTQSLDTKNIFSR